MPGISESLFLPAALMHCLGLKTGGWCHKLLVILPCGCSEWLDCSSFVMLQKKMQTSAQGNGVKCSLFLQEDGSLPWESCPSRLVNVPKFLRELFLLTSILRTVWSAVCPWFSDALPFFVVVNVEPIVVVLKIPLRGMSEKLLDHL